MMVSSFGRYLGELVARRVVWWCRGNVEMGWNSVI